MEKNDNNMDDTKVEKIIFDDHISDEEMENCRKKYETIREPSETDQFQFALNLIRSNNNQEIEEGVKLFQDIFTKTKDDNIKRDTLYYMAIGETKLNNYDKALKYLQTILNIEPNNYQVRDLYAEVNKRMKRDGFIGLGIVSGAAVSFVGLLGLGAVIFGKKN